MKSFSLVVLGVISVISIVSLILMFNTTTTGLGTFNIKPGRAVKMISEKRPYVGGNPEGVIVGTFERKGYRDWAGKEPCPDGYRIQTKKIRRQEKCTPTNYPERYPDWICCPADAY
ncbi:hypothetical protein KY346_01555 [Candidatus Woesearchaeota archaeon]|nr:hypothetical protein [Candidatus Woesearchaeota archaeon]